jgi:hypothetical protein
MSTRSLPQRRTSKVERASTRRKGPRFHRPRLEALEDRICPSALTDSFNSLQGQLDSSLRNPLGSFSDAALPLIGNHLASAVDQGFAGGLMKAIGSNLDQHLGGSPTAQNVYDALSPLHLVSSLGQISVTPSGNSFDISVALHSNIASVSETFTTGLAALPIKIVADPNHNASVTLQVSVDYQLAFIYTPSSDAVSFKADTLGGTSHQMAVNVQTSLQNFNPAIQVGFLYGTATALPGTGFQASFYVSGLNGGGGAASVGISGTATANLRLALGFGNDFPELNSASPLPSISTDFHLIWTFDPNNPGSHAPTVSFDNTQFHFGSFLGQVLAPIMSKVEDVTQPIEPVIKVLKTPIPGINDLSEFLGQGEFTIETVLDDVLKVFGLGPVADVLDAFTTIINGVNQFGTDGSNDVFLQLGGFDLSSAANGDLRNDPAAHDVNSPDANTGDLTNLSVNPVGAIETARDLINQYGGKIGQDLSNAIFPAPQVQFSVPLLDDPSSVFYGLLLGRNTDLVSLDVNLDQSPPELRVPSGLQFAGLGVDLDAHFHFDVHFHIGYDTYGLMELLRQLESGQSADVLSDIGDGVYITPDSNNDPLFSISGFIGARAGFSIGFAGVSVEGGLYTGVPQSGVIGDGNVDAPISVSLNTDTTTSNDHRVRVRDHVFDRLTSQGQITAGINIILQIGVNSPLGFVGYQQPFTIASVTLLSLNHQGFAPPPPQLATFDSNTGTLTLNVGKQDQFEPDQPGVNEDFKIERGSFDFNFNGTNNLIVSAYGNSKEFTGVKLIDATGDQQNLRIIIDSLVSVDANLAGGSGSTQLTYLGSGTATLSGGDQSSILKGGSGTNHLHGKAGKDVLYGGTGTNHFYPAGGKELMIVEAAPGAVNTIAPDFAETDDILEVVGTLTGVQSIAVIPVPFAPMFVEIDLKDKNGTVLFHVAALDHALKEVLLPRAIGVTKIDIGDLSQTELEDVQVSTAPASRDEGPATVTIQTSSNAGDVVSVQTDTFHDSVNNTSRFETDVGMSHHPSDSGTLGTLYLNVHLFGTRPGDNFNLVGNAANDEFQIKPDSNLPLTFTIQNPQGFAGDTVGLSCVNFNVLNGAIENVIVDGNGARFGETIPGNYLLIDEAFLGFFHENTVSWDDTIKEASIQTRNPQASSVHLTVAGDLPAVETDITGTDNTYASTNTFDVNGLNFSQLVLDGNGASRNTFNINDTADLAYAITVKDSGHIIPQTDINVPVRYTAAGDVNTLNVNHQNLSTSGGFTYTVSTASVIRNDTMPGLFAFPSSINYSNITRLVLNSGPDGNVFNVQSTAAGTPTTINAGPGGDFVNVTETDDQVAGLIPGLAGHLSVNGAGNTSLLLDDRAIRTQSDGEGFLVTPTLNDYTVSDNGGTTGTLSRGSGMLVFNPFVPATTAGGSSIAIDYTGLGMLTLQGGPQGGNLFHVLGTGGTSAAVINVNSSGAPVGIGDPHHGLIEIGNLTVHGASDASTTMALDDEANVNQVVTVPVPTGVNPDGSLFFTLEDISSSPDPVSYMLTDGNIRRQGSVTTTYSIHPSGPVLASGSHTYNMNVSYDNLASISMIGGAIKNTFNVQSETVPITIKAGAGEGGGNGATDGPSLGDIVNVGDPQLGMDPVTGRITFHGAGNSELNLKDQANDFQIQQSEDDTFYLYPNPTFQVTNSSATRKDHVNYGDSFGQTGSYDLSGVIDYDNLALMTIKGGKRANEYDVQQSSIPIIITAGPSNDLVKIGDSQNSLDAVGPSVTVFGNANTKLVLDDTGTKNSFYDLGDSGFTNHVDASVTFAVDGDRITRTNQQSYTITSVSYRAPGTSPPPIVSTFTAFSVGQVEIDGASPGSRFDGQPGGNMFNVMSTDLQTSTTIKAGIAGDTVNLGTPGSRLDYLAGPVAVEGAGNTTLNLNDQAGTPGTAPNQAYNYDLEKDSFSRTGTPAFTFNSIAAVNVYAANTGGSGFNALGIRSTAAGTAYNVYAGTGENLFIVNDINETLNGIQGNLALHGAFGPLPNNDAVFLNDLDKTSGHMFQVTAGATPESGQVQRESRVTGLPDMATITYDGLNAYSVLDTAGSAGSIINVQSQASDLWTIIAVGKGDTVNIGNTTHTMSAFQGDLRIQGVLGQTPTVNVDDALESNAQPINMGNDPSTGYLVNGLLPQTSGRGRLWFELDPASPVYMYTGARTFHLHDITGAPTFTVVGVGGTFDTGTTGLAGNFDHTLTLGGFGAASMHVLGDWSGSLLAPTVGTLAAPIDHITIDGSMLAGSRLKVDYLGPLTINGNMDGTVDGYGVVADPNTQFTIGAVTVGGQWGVDGSITAPSIQSINMKPASTFAGQAHETMPAADFRSLNLGTITATGEIDAGAIGSATITGDMDGHINVSGPLGPFSVGGNLDGSVTAQTVTSASVGKDFTGQINVMGTLGGVSVGGNSSGTVAAGQLTTLGAPHAQGPVILDFTQGGVERKLLATAVPGYALDAVSFSYSVDASGPGNPKLTVHVTNTDTVHDRFDLSLLSSSPGAGFDLALLDAQGGPAGLRDLAVDGNVRPGAANLPQDQLGSVAAWGDIAAGSIQAGDLQAVAFASVSETCQAVSAATADSDDALRALARGTHLVQANGTFQVPFGAQPLVAFLDLGNDDDSGLGKILFSEQLPGTALAQITVTSARSGCGDDDHRSHVQTIALQGSGAAIDTNVPIYTSITSTGSLGDLTIRSERGLTADVTAPSFIGNIDVTEGPLAGTIQTTQGDLGRVFTDAAGKAHTTFVHSAGEMSGRIISRGNLVSRVVADDEISGVIAAQGDLGVVSGGKRLGGIVAKGGFSGQIVVLGSMLPDMFVQGEMDGRIAVKHNISGNVTIDGTLDKDADIVAGGSIGDATSGTSLSADSIRGIVAADGNIVPGKDTGTRKAAFFAPYLQGTADGAAIDAVFSDMGTPLTFDSAGQDLHGLQTILDHLASLQVSGGHLQA